MWIRVQLGFEFYGYAHNKMHMLKREKQIRDIVFLSLYVYVCACEYI